jgi:ATP-dependent Lon protease
VAYNPVEDDDYTFYIDELRPIQISKFSFEAFCEARKQFTSEEWLTVVLRTLGIEPSSLTRRTQFHFLARLFPLVEQNYNFLELGPRGTGKSYAYSEFTPYSTLISGGQTSTASLFYNKQRRAVGIIGFWDTIAFDEVAGIKVKDSGTIQILKDYMANGHFNIAAEIAAPASLVFVGNIDDSIAQLVVSEYQDLCKPLPKEFDLAVIHRFHTYVPGWEIPPNSSKLLTGEYGLITDYLAEAFHYIFKRINLYATIKGAITLNKKHEGRDETAVIKTVAAFYKLLHPGAEPTPTELDEYLTYAIEGRRRVKEQLNKRKKDDEFANVDLGFTNSAGEDVIVWCPESKAYAGGAAGECVQVAQAPAAVVPVAVAAGTSIAPVPVAAVPQETARELKAKEVRIFHGDRGYSYANLFSDYLQGAKRIVVSDPYIRTQHQIVNFLRFCEVCVELGTVEEIALVTVSDDEPQKQETQAKLYTIQNSLEEHGIKLSVQFSETLHDRRIETDQGWVINLGRGLDFYQRPDDWLEVGANDLGLRKCHETTIAYYRKGEERTIVPA